MNRVIASVVYFPALVGWVIFAPCFRLANLIYPNGGRYAVWSWCGIDAADYGTLGEHQEDRP